MAAALPLADPKPKEDAKALLGQCRAAYGVETLVASTGLKYGGPNNTTANDAFGAFQFEIWEA